MTKYMASWTKPVERINEKRSELNNPHLGVAYQDHKRALLQKDDKYVFFHLKARLTDDIGPSDGRYYYNILLALKEIAEARGQMKSLKESIEDILCGDSNGNT
jgi:hypothetical protein